MESHLAELENRESRLAALTELINEFFAGRDEGQDEQKTTFVDSRSIA